MPTVLELALLSMDVYEQHDDGLNQNGGVGQFSAGTQFELGSFYARSYSNGTDDVIAYEGSTTSTDILNSSRSPDRSKR